MSRRRRLALRQVAEPETTAALSDVEDVAVAEPNFNLLGMMLVEEDATAHDISRTVSLPSAPVPGSPRSLVYTDADGDEYMDLPATQIVPSMSQKGSSDVVQPAKKARVEASTSVVPPREMTSTTAFPASVDHPRGIFQLYQTGLCDDHTLRLHFIRHRPPPPPETPVENKFVLPRPRLSFLNMLPPQIASISDILRSDEAANNSIHPLSMEAALPTNETVESAKTHWRQLGSVNLAELVSSWCGLQEYEWVRVYEASGAYVPSPKDLICLLETLQSDAFASFVWRQLLVPTVHTLYRDKASPSTVTQFITALLNHEFFRRLPAKQFRAELRAKNLRANCNDASFGAATEMEVITHFHKFRNQNG